MTTATKTTTDLIQVHSRYTDLLWTIEQVLASIRSGNLWVNERLARLAIPAITGHDAKCESVHVDGRRVCIVDLGHIEDEFRTWKEAVLYYAELYR